MPNAKLVCRICGKEYEACMKWETAEKFRWQNVACCPEHGAEYFVRVLKARGESIPEDEQLFKDYLHNNEELPKEPNTEIACDECEEKHSEEVVLEEKVVRKRRK